MRVPCFIALGLAVLGAAAYAQDQTPAPGGSAPPAPPAPPFAAPKAPQKSDGITTISSGVVGQNGTAPRGRAISTGAAAALAAATPRFDAPLAKDDTPVPPPDLPDTPKNQILRLDPLVIEGSRATPVFDQKQILSQRDLAAMLIQRYLSELDRGILNRWTVPLLVGSNQDRVLAEFNESERLRNISDLNNDADNAQRAGNADQAAYIRKTTTETFMRQIPWGFSRSRDSNSAPADGADRLPVDPRLK